MKKGFSFFLVLTLVFPAYCLSAPPYIFLKIPPHARAAGMAEAYTTLADGTYGLYYNPAGIPNVMGFEAQLSWVPWIQKTQFFHFAIVNPWEIFGCGKIGASVSLARSGREEAGMKFFPIDWSAYPLSINSIYGLNAALGAGFTFIQGVSGGINLKFNSLFMDDGDKAYNFGMDIGVLAGFEMQGQVLKIGAIASNYGYELLTNTEGFDVPAKITAAISDKFDLLGGDFIISAETAFSTDTHALFRLGFEYTFFGCVSLRAGYKMAAMNHPMFGAGFKYEGLEIHYAFEEYEGMGSIHDVSLLYSWGTPPAGLQSAFKLISPNGDGVLDRAVFVPKLEQLQRVKAVRVNIYRQSGEKAGEVPVPNKYAKAIEWDGKLKGKTVPDGRYLIELEAEYDTNGSSVSRRFELQVDSSAPSLSIVKDAAKGGISGLPLVLALSAEDESRIVTWEIRITGPGGEELNVEKGAGNPPASYEWNGMGQGGAMIAKGSKYFYILRAVDAAGNSAVSAAKQGSYSPAKREITLTFASDALFEPGKAAVKTSAYTALKKIKSELKKYPGAEFVIFGHTDNREPAGGYETRLKLSKARAKAVEYYMKNLLGIKSGYVMTDGYGDKMPVSKEDTESGRAKNRRVEVIIQTVIIE